MSLGTTPGGARQITRTETRGSWLLWFAVLGSPLAWATHLVVSYSLEEWFACSPSAGEPGEILGFSVRTVAIAVNAVLAVVAAAAFVSALACRRRLPAASGDERLDRARWMALAAIVEGALFAPAILLGLVPPVMLGVCETVP